MARLYIYQNPSFESIKCYGCGWAYGQLFFTANSDEEAEEIRQKLDKQLLEDKDENDAVALCGECMCEILVDGKYELS